MHSIFCSQHSIGTIPIIIIKSTHFILIHFLKLYEQTLICKAGIVNNFFLTHLVEGFLNN